MTYNNSSYLWIFVHPCFAVFGNIFYGHNLPFFCPYFMAIFVFYFMAIICGPYFFYSQLNIITKESFSASSDMDCGTSAGTFRRQQLQNVNNSSKGCLPIPPGKNQWFHHTFNKNYIFKLIKLFVKICIQTLFSKFFEIAIKAPIIRCVKPIGIDSIYT